jgi:glycerophosphoryl diester phosphodiesterase
MIHKRIKQWVAGALAAAMVFALCPQQRAQAAKFTDTSGHWAEQYINQAVDLGLFSGTTSTTFSPDTVMTRAMFVTVLAKYSKEDISSYTTTQFEDVPADAWYAHAVAWAYSGGLISGTSSNKFSPNSAITREQMAFLIVQFANYQRFVLPRTRSTQIFSDRNQTADYALDAVYTLYRSGIMSGTSSSAFSPTGKVTRAQCAVVFCLYNDAQQDEEPADEQVRLVNHRGYSLEAPENTMPAYALSVRKGYRYVETDVQFTKDNVPVLIHDTTIDRTSNGTGNVADLTYGQLQNYDFSYKSNSSERWAGYEGTKIATFEEFISFCSRNHLHPYIEMKIPMTQSQVCTLFELTKQYNMQDNVTWISFYVNDLLHLRDYDDAAPLCLLTNKVDSNAIKNAQLLKNGKDTIIIGANSRSLTAAQRATILRNNIHWCVWTIDSLSPVMQYANSSAEAVTTDNITPSEVYPDD